MKSSFCIDLQRFMLIPTKFPLSRPLLYELSYVGKIQKKESSRRMTLYMWCHQESNRGHKANL